MIELAAYICMCICGAGVIYGASAELIRELRFELVGKWRRKRLEQPKPLLRLARHYGMRGER